MAFHALRCVAQMLKQQSHACAAWLQGYSVTMPKEESGAAPGAAGTEGRQGSAGSNEGNSGSRSKDPSSGETEAISEPQPPLLQRQVCLTIRSCTKAVESCSGLLESPRHQKARW